MRFSSRYVHKISPSERDVGPTVELSIADLENRRTLGAALRRVHIMSHGDSIRSYRVEARRVIVFPNKSIWHSIILSEQ